MVPEGAAEGRRWHCLAFLQAGLSLPGCRPGEDLILWSSLGLVQIRIYSVFQQVLIKLNKEEDRDVLGAPRGVCVGFDVCHCGDWGHVWSVAFQNLVHSACKQLLSVSVGAQPAVCELFCKVLSSGKRSFCCPPGVSDPRPRLGFDFIVMVNFSRGNK